MAFRSECQDDVGLLDTRRRKSKARLPESIKKKLEYPPDQLFQIGEQLHYLQKRTLPGFRRVWSKNKSLSLSRNLPASPSGSAEIKVISIQESQERLYVTLAYFLRDAGVGKTIEVEALLGAP